jgi:hypothetical protein
MHNVTGISFSVKSKEEMATILWEKMRSGEVKIPYIPLRNLGDIALSDKTPAQVCGIKIEGKNKWLTLIQNASQNKWEFINRVESS